MALILIAIAFPSFRLLYLMDFNLEVLYMLVNQSDFQAMAAGVAKVKAIPVGIKNYTQLVLILYLLEHKSWFEFRN